MQRLIYCLAFAISLFASFANAAGFEWRETRWGSGSKASPAKLAALTSKNMNVVSFIGGFNYPDKIAAFAQSMHAAGFKVAAGGHSYTKLGGCVKAWECLDAYLAGLKAWANGPAKDADFILLWPDDKNRKTYEGHQDDIWNVFLAAQKALPDRQLIGIAYSSYTQPPSFPLPKDTLVEIAVFDRLDCVPLSEQPVWVNTLQAWSKAGVRPILFAYGTRSIWNKQHLNVWCPSVQQADAKYVYSLGFYGMSDFGANRRGRDNYLHFAELAENVDAPAVTGEGATLETLWRQANPCGRKFCGTISPQLMAPN